MSLGSYQAPSHEFALAGGSFTVKGLSLQDVTILVHNHMPDLEALFDLFTSAQGVTDQDLRPLAVSLLAQAPGFAANVIALAAGEPDMAPVAQTLPAPLQIDVLLKVGDMTFSEVGGVKKALESIVPLLTSGLAKINKQPKATMQVE